VSGTEALDLLEAQDLAEAVAAGGGTLSLVGDDAKLFLPGYCPNLLPRLKKHKLELIVLLRLAGGWIARLPMCPKCGSYALYRKNNIGAFECLTCELQGIEERNARIASFLTDSRAPRRGM
jgi:Zn ribbon nucleic-acid-binding protein